MSKERVKVFDTEAQYTDWKYRNCGNCQKGFALHQKYKCDIELEIDIEVGEKMEQFDQTGKNEAPKFRKSIAECIRPLNKKCGEFDDGTKKEPPMPLPGQQSLFGEKP